MPNDHRSMDSAPMRPFRPVRRRLLLAAAASLPVACAAPRYEAAPPGAAIVAPRVGQRWRYAEINLYNGQTRAELEARVVESTPKRIRIGLVAHGGKPRDDEIYADPARIVQEPLYDFTQVFEEPVPVLSATLDAGAKSRVSTHYHTPQSPGDRLWWGDWLVARGWERVRVPAGEFLALRVDRTIRFQHVDIWRENCTRWDYSWYAPEVGRWVMREWWGEWFMPSGPVPTRVYEDRVRWVLLDSQRGA